MIYFDNNATTPLCEEAQQAWLKVCSLPLNESSTHQLGRQAKAHLMNSTDVFSRYFDITNEQILFTASATEAINTFLHSFCQNRSGHIIAGTTEHAAVLETLKKHSKNNWRVDWIEPNNDGSYDLNKITSCLQADTKLVVLMKTNNETGVNTDLAPIGRFLKEKGIELFVDAVATAGKHPFKWFEGLTATVISAHKFHGPLGVAALALCKGYKINPLLFGGAQQKGRRAGTVNLPLVVSASAALDHFLKNQDTYITQMKDLRDSFENKIQALIDGVEINGGKDRSSNVSNLFFDKVEAETLVMQLDHSSILVSQGSACQSGASEPSHVIRAMHGIERAKSSVRFSFSRMNTLEEVDEAIHKIKHAVEFQRSLL